MRIKTIIRKQREYKRMGLVIKELRKLSDHIDMFESKILDSYDEVGVKDRACRCTVDEIDKLKKQRDEMEV